MLQLNLWSDGAFDSKMTLNISKPCNLEVNAKIRNIRGVRWMKLDENNDRKIILLNTCVYKVYL